MIRTTLPTQFIISFLHFVNSTLDSHIDNERQLQILGLILYKFEEGHRMMKSKMIEDLLQPIHVWITRLNRYTLFILAHITSLSPDPMSDRLNRVFLSIPGIFTSNIELHCRDFTLGELKQMHKCMISHPAVKRNSHDDLRIPV
jgi:hypothetical protein